MTTEPEKDPADDAGIEQLLRKVGARDEPSAVVMDEVRVAVRAEWQAGVGARRASRRKAAWAIAAGLAVVGAVALTRLPITSPQPIPIARVAHVDGQLRVRDGDGRWAARTVGQVVASRETTQTDARSRAGLALAGNVSLRLDSNTTLQFVSVDRVRLQSGAVYIDTPVAATDDTPADHTLIVETPAGSVRHVGTQYQVRTDGETLEVSVREGYVQIRSAAGTSIGAAGEQIRISSDGGLSRSVVSAQDAGWKWVTSATPPFDIQDRPLSSFLDWVARETGRKLIYQSPRAQAAAAEVRLRGSIAGLDPDTALTAVLSGTQLRRYETTPEFIGITLAEE